VRLQRIGSAIWWLFCPESQWLSFPSPSVGDTQDVGHTFLMKETEWGRTKGTRSGSNGYESPVQMKLGIGHTSVGLTHTRPITIASFV